MTTACAAPMEAAIKTAARRSPERIAPYRCNSFSSTDLGAKFAAISPVEKARSAALCRAERWAMLHALETHEDSHAGPCRKDALRFRAGRSQPPPACRHADRPG